MEDRFLEIQGLTKYYGKALAIDRLSLSVNKGEIFGLLGCNGSGKTTLIKCILQLLRISEGQLRCQGKPLSFEHIQRDFGYLPEHFFPPQELTGGEFLRILGVQPRVNPTRVSILLAELQLDEKKSIGKYSRGMSQRLGLATALLKNPLFLLLDEPTLGLDPAGQVHMLSTLQRLQQQGKTIFFSSHNLFHIEKVCHRIGIMCQGSLSFVGTTSEFMRLHRGASFEEAFLKAVGAHA